MCYEIPFKHIKRRWQIFCSFKLSKSISVFYFSVHGNWGSWLDWSECSQSCNGGTQSRARYCDDPAPDLYGLECTGTNMSSQTCNTDICPGKTYILII